MRIKQLLIRTTKPDETKEDYRLEHRMERAGFIKTHEKMSFYTPLGVLLRDAIEQYVIGFLKDENFVKGHTPKAKAVSDMVTKIAVINDVLVTSYKELPVRLFYQETLKLNQGNDNNLWQMKEQKVLGLSTIGFKEDNLEQIMDKVLMSLVKSVVRSQRSLFYPVISGKETFKADGDFHKVDQDHKNFSVKELVKIETKGIKTVRQLCRYLAAEPEDILKTMLYSDGEDDYAVIVVGSKEVDEGKLSRVLGMAEGQLSQKNELSIKKDLLVSTGYIGPMGLKVKEMLIDDSVLKEKPYLAGANEEDFHINGVTYGRDYKGNFYDLAKDSTEENGWVLAEKRERLPMLRVQNAESIREFVPLQAGYINLDRVVLALCHQAMDNKGFDFPKCINWFQGVVTAVDPRDIKTLEAVERVYQILLKAGFNVIHDPRRDRLGSKFNDYDLISIPYRIILGKNFEEEFDLKNRQGDLIKVNFENIASTFKKIVLE